MSLIFKRFSSTAQSTLSGKTALITGGSRGLGLYIAKKLSEKGVNIILLSRQGELLNHNIQHELKTVNTNQHHDYIQCDLSNPDTFPETISTSLSKLKSTSILINCAGISQNSLLLSTPPHLISQILNTNLTSSITLTQILMKTLIRNTPSNVINISSVLGLKGFKGTAVYGASKAGLIGFSRSLAVEMGPKNIRVNSISPGLITETEMGKGIKYDNVLGKDGVSLNDVYKAVEFLLENQSVTGQNIVVDNGIVV